jgi:glycosyltransferase involved in cell wall biosynthesis
MRILIANLFPLDGSGSGTYCADVGAALVRGGHEVLVLAPDHVARAGYSFAVRTLLCQGEPARHPGHAPHAPHAQLAFNFPCFTSHPRSTLTFGELDRGQIEAYLAAWQAALDESIASFRPDVLHTNHTWILPYLAEATGLPYVITCHGTDLLGLRRWPQFAAMAHAGVAGAHAIVAVSRHSRSELLAAFPEAEPRVHLILNGFDPVMFRVLPDLDRRETLTGFGVSSPQGPVIVFAGKLTDEKRVAVLVRAAAQYEAQLPGARTLIAGAGPEEEELRILAGRLGLTGVSFLGHLPHARLAQLYNAADLCVFPSRCEPFGLVAIEAMACGAPVVVTNAGGFRDFVTDEVGSLVPVDDPAALAEAIVAEIRQGSKLTKGVYAATRALAHYPWEQQIGKLTQLYEEAVSQSSAA